MKRARIGPSKKAQRERKLQVAVWYYSDGREKCLRNETGMKEYTSRRSEMAHRQGWLCAICWQPMIAPQFDHEAGRHPTRRDDRILKPDGVTWQNAALCGNCNCSVKGSRHYHWTDGNTRYIPVERAA